MSTSTQFSCLPDESGNSDERRRATDTGTSGDTDHRADAATDTQGSETDVAGDTGRDTSAFGDIPEEQEAQPMTCDWLDQGNCWSNAVGQIDDCLPDNEAGEMSEDTTACTFSDGTRIVWNSSTELPTSESESLLRTAAFKIVSPSGDRCLETKTLGFAHVAFDIDGDVTVLRADGFAGCFTVICPDSSTYQACEEGSCDDLAERNVDGGLPGFDVICQGDSRQCDLRFRGGPTGEQEVLATCNY